MGWFGELVGYLLMVKCGKKFVFCKVVGVVEDDVIEWFNGNDLVVYEVLFLGEWIEVCII